MSLYIHQKHTWPQFTWDNEALIFLLAKVRNQQGLLLGRMGTLGFDLKNEASLEALTLDVIKSSEIEGEILNVEQVRSSIAVRLGLEFSGLPNSDRHIDGVVDMLIDATQHFQQTLSKQRLCNWHYALFPTGRSGIYPIVVGDWRNDSTGPMQVVSGALGKEKVHYQAPDAVKLDVEMALFLKWFNENENLDPIIKAAIAHLWFVTIHPFDDGNGRMARALTDLLLARADGMPQRFYSMSAQVRKERKAYYDILERTQKGDLDITEWLHWFLTCLLNALEESQEISGRVVFKHQFWSKNAPLLQNDRQRLVLEKYLSGFEGKLTSSKWAKLAKCSEDSALRDLNYLVENKVLKKSSERGRSTSYEVAGV